MAKKKGALAQWMKKPAPRVAMKVLSAIFKCFLTIVLIGVITASMVGCVLIVYVVTQFDPTTDIPDLREIRAEESTIIYTKNSSGEYEEHQRLEGANRIWVSLEEIPENMRNAVIAIEDERFNDHYGVDWKRTISAMANLVLHFSSQEYGGSTITQQLVKIITKDNDHSIQRKITEIMRAIEMERNQYTKDDIIEAYLNVLPLTGNIVGVGAGANYYFGKDVKDLTLAQCAVLASITQNPSKYNPYTHPENIRSRQRVVLYKMNELGFITDDEYRQALGEELHFKSSVRRELVQDYYCDMVIEDVIRDLMDKYGYNYSYAESIVYYGGLRIYSAENPSQQEAVEAIYANEKNFPAVIKSDKENPQGALFVMDYTGRVVATAGGRGEKNANRVQNRSTMSVRQPGSAMKPLSVYTQAIELDLITYSTMMRDAPVELPGQGKWPPNYDGRYGTGGYVPVENALYRSLNTVPAQLIMQLTPERSYDFCVNTLHFTSLIESMVVTDSKGNKQVLMDKVPSLALGAMTKGVYCSEMAAAYQIFGNGGVYNKPYSYTQVKRGADEVLLEYQESPQQAVSEDTAYVMNRLLQRVVKVGTASGTLGSSWKGWEVFAKTGTTDKSVDVYLAGGTPYYVGASWFGYDYNKGLNGRQTSYAMRLWNACMKELHKGLSAKPFDKKGTTVEKAYCKTSGKLATAACPSKGTGVYKASNVPGYCDQHGGGSAATTTVGGTATSAPSTQGTASSTTQAVSSAPVSSHPGEESR